ncbi:MAG: REP-associated tyrosine transposase [Chitinophagales bacterium]
MPEGYKIRDQEGSYFMTFTVVDWIDVFSRKRYCDILLESFTYCRKEKGLLLSAYVIMSNHVHVIAKSSAGELSELVGSIKKFISKKIITSIKEEPESRREWMLHRFEYAAKYTKRNEQYQFWTHDNHPEGIFTPQFFDQKLHYIHMNPVRAGIVELPEHYLYSSARNYAGLNALIEIDLD